jgi:hypothetical protein
MRLSICVAAIASVTLFERCLAAPSFRSSGKWGMNESLSSAALETEDEEVLKYFHEPGYVGLYPISSIDSDNDQQDR